MSIESCARGVAAGEVTPQTRYMKGLRWPSRAEQHAYMKERQRQNIVRAAVNPNENWLARRLASTGLTWTRQALWGYRIFDFWCHELGIAIESDGPEHDRAYDAYRDEYNLRRSGIVVLRVRNRNESDLRDALNVVSASVPWTVRRERLGLRVPGKRGRRHLVKGQLELLSD